MALTRSYQTRHYGHSHSPALGYEPVALITVPSKLLPNGKLFNSGKYAVRSYYQSRAILENQPAVNFAPHIP